MKDTKKAEQREVTLLRKKHILYAAIVVVVLAGLHFGSTVANASDEKAKEDVPSEEAIPEPNPDEGGGFWDKISSSVSDIKDKVSKKYNDTAKDVSVKAGMSISDEKADDLEQEYEFEISETKAQMITDLENDMNQIDCLTRALVFEAGGEPDLGKRWVLHVIHNRKEAGYRGENTYCGVIYDRKQFSFANVNPDRVPTFTEDLIESKKMAVAFYYRQDKPDLTDCATHYLVNDIVKKVDWSRQALEGESPENLEKKAVIGNHTFFGPPSC